MQRLADWLVSIKLVKVRFWLQSRLGEQVEWALDLFRHNEFGDFLTETLRLSRRLGILFQIFGCGLRKSKFWVFILGFLDRTWGRRVTGVRTWRRFLVTATLFRAWGWWALDGLRLYLGSWSFVEFFLHDLFFLKWLLLSLPGFQLLGLRTFLFGARLGLSFWFGMSRAQS